MCFLISFCFSNSAIAKVVALYKQYRKESFNQLYEKNTKNKGKSFRSTTFDIAEMVKQKQNEKHIFSNKYVVTIFFSFLYFFLLVLYIDSRILFCIALPSIPIAIVLKGDSEK